MSRKNMINLYYEFVLGNITLCLYLLFYVHPLLIIHFCFFNKFVNPLSIQQNNRHTFYSFPDCFIG